MREREDGQDGQNVPGSAQPLEKNGQLVEYFVSVGGQLRLVLVYLPQQRLFIKKYPASRNASRDGIVTFDEKRGKMILQNYTHMGAEIVAYPITTKPKIERFVQKMLEQLKADRKIVLFRGVA